MQYYTPDNTYYPQLPSYYPQPQYQQPVQTVNLQSLQQTVDNMKMEIRAMQLQIQEIMKSIKK